MKVYKFNDYNEYIKNQLKGYKKKKNKCWVFELNIKFLAEYMQFEKINPTLGLCHGTRGGFEQLWFRQYLPLCEVFGTEIGDTDANYTFKWDFNKKNPEWKDKFDFIYSNSFDHAFDPMKTLNIWAGQIKPGGIIMLEYDKQQEHTGEISASVNKMDCVSITVSELIERIPIWIKNVKIKTVLDMPQIKNEFQKTIIIQKDK